MEAFMPTGPKIHPQKTRERKTTKVEKMFKPMLVSGLTLDPLTNSPIVILKEVDGDRPLRLPVN